MGSVRGDARLYRVHLSIADIRHGVTSVPVDRADVTLRVPLDRIADASGIPGLTLKGDGTQIVATAPVAVPEVGKVTVTARGTVAFVDGKLTVKLGAPTVLGGSVPLPTPIPGDALNFGLALTGLPYDASVDSVEVSGSDAVISGHASGVTLG